MKISLKHPDRMNVLTALDALDPPEWAEFIAQNVPIVEAHALVNQKAAVQRLRAVVQAEHEKD